MDSNELLQGKHDRLPPPVPQESRQAGTGSLNRLELYALASAERVFRGLV